MKDERKTKKQLIDELRLLRRELAGQRRRDEDPQEDRAALKESAENFRTALDQSIDGITITRGDQRVFLNQGCLTMLGYGKPGEIAKKPLFFFVHPDDRGKLAEINRQIQNGEMNSCRHEFRMVKKDGSVIYVEGSVSVITRDHKPTLLQSFRDITKRKEMEDALRESEEKYITILDEMEDGYLEVDTRGNFTFFNESFRKIFGYSRNEMMGTNFSVYAADEESAKKVYLDCNAMYRMGDPFRKCDWDILTKDGIRRTLEYYVSLIRNAEGRSTGLRGIIRDVTERRRTEEQYRIMANNSQVGVYIVQDGKMQFANPHIPKYSGYPEAELIGADILSFVHPDDRDTVRKKARMMLKGEISSPYEYRIIDKSGRVLWLMETVTPISYRGKQAALGNTMDITESKMAVEERRLLESQLLQAQKMEAIGTLAGGVAHDFNNLLMGIQGCTSLMLLETDTYHPHFEKLKSIEDQVKSGADLTRQLLGFARGGKYEVRPTDLNEVIERTSTMFGRTKKEIRIHRKYESSLWSAEADQGQIEQVLLNLYVNAWQAMPGGGELYLETQNIVLKEDHRMSFTVIPGNYVKVSVTDTGVGMDAKTQKRIFEPFFTTKEMGRGTGLGLATVYGIIKGHKGIINVYSEKGHGTTFTIYLPASDREVTRETDRRHTGEPLRGHETILLIDDEAVILEVTGEILESLGYRLLTAGSGSEALEVYRREQDRIDLVILDMIMPGMGGRETFERLRAINPGVKAILSSGYSLNGEAYGILEQGCLAFIQKPFSIHAVSRKIREVLENEQALIQEPGP